MAKIEIGIIMGSQSDWPTMREAADILDALAVPYETRIVSAHRTPDRLWDYGKTAVERGLKVIIAGAGGAAHLPGMMASKTRLPVIGVPVQTKALSGVDSLYSILQMPRGFPVATMAIGSAGAANAGWLSAASLVALGLTGAGYGVLFGAETWAGGAILAAVILGSQFTRATPTAWTYPAALAWALTGIMIANWGGFVWIAGLAGGAALFFVVFGLCNIGQGRET